MVLDKIRNFCQNYKVSLEPKVSIKPSITLFGILSFELLEIEPKDAVELEVADPDNWSPEIKSKISDYLEKILDISLEEYSSQLKKELKTTKIDLIESILEGVEKSIKENPLLTLEEFESRTENRDICGQRYSCFVGRQDDLNVLKDFLTISSNKILVLTGLGAVGKTRLSIEFARLVKREMEDWDVYFIHRENNFNRFHARKYTLLILDETSRYPEIEKSKLIDFVLHPPKESSDMKLILIERPIFKDSIESELRERYASFTNLHLEKGEIAEWYASFTNLHLEKGEIAEFLQQNLDVNAIIYTEYFKEKGKINESKNILAHRVEKYANDICKRSSYRIEEVKLALSRISLITPIRWSEDKEFLKMYKKDLDVVEEIIRLSDSKNLDIFFYRQNPTNKNSNIEYDFRYDPMANFLRAEYIEKDESTDWIQRHISHFPYRMAYNLFLIQRYYPSYFQKVSQNISDIWVSINSSKGNNLEYFKAFLFFTSKFLQSNSQSLEELNLKHFIDSYNFVSSSKCEHEVSSYFTMTLANLVALCGRAERFEDISNCLKEMRELYIKCPENVAENLASGLINAILGYGGAGRFEDVSDCLKETGELYAKHPNDVTEIFGKGLTNAIYYYGSAGQFEDVSDCIKKMKELYKNHPQNVAKEFTCGLKNAVCYYGSAGQFEDLSNCLKQVRELYSKHPNDVAKEFAGGLTNAILGYGNAGRFKDVSDCIKEMRKLYLKHQKDVAEELANGLTNAILVYGSAGQFEDVNNCLKEIREVYTKYPKDVAEKLANGLTNAISRYGSAGRFDDVNDCLNEMEELYVKYPDNIAEKLASGLINAIKYYSSANRSDDLSDCLKRMRELYTKHPPNVGKKLACGLINAIGFYGSSGLFEDMRYCLKEMEELYTKDPGNATEEYPQGLYNAISHYGSAGRFEEMKYCLKEMKGLYIKSPESIAELFAKGLYNAIYRYDISGRFDDVNNCLEEMKEIYTKYPENVAKPLAKGLISAINYYNSIGRFYDLNDCLKEMKELYTKYPKFVAEEYASVARVFGVI
ncbi:hypothetical protein FXV91_04645 [Methanosarcina sp. DH2]|uniref:hypothetical protein n=1 Tax=Methanosarcina sp. DH2 TaxID=2605639 RepID=UPI001E4FF080|nr:hypothetical protein [Methanosarcina sp. DH2]MCC4769510.1 hypothetical protein [Methanosarcina sp. DH2]